MSNPEKPDDKPAPAQWAAEEPTAMWDESAMRGQGYDALAKDREDKPREATGPATEREVRGDVKQGVEVSRALTGTHGKLDRAPAPAPKASALSWVITLGIAIALGVGVFFVVRMLR